MGENPVDPTAPKQIRLCRTFARKIYGGDLDVATKIFDPCGIYLSAADEDRGYFAWGNGETTVAIPSKNPYW